MVDPMVGMSYLDIARSARGQQTPGEEGIEVSPSLPDCDQSACEKSELSEKRWSGASTAVMTHEEAEELKQAILAAVVVEPELFDRELYDELMEQWLPHEAALATQGDEEACA